MISEVSLFIRSLCNGITYFGYYFEEAQDIKHEYGPLFNCRPVATATGANVPLLILLRGIFYRLARE